MCEYAHATYAKCLTTSPSKVNCNAQYRNQHYNLNSGQIHSCNENIKDIKYYLSIFPNGIFPKEYSSQIPLDDSNELFYFRNAKRDVDGKAEILINCGHTQAPKTVLKAGSKVSIDVSDSFNSSNSIKIKRQNVEYQKKIIDRILQEDISFDSQSGAGEFLNGTSFNGNIIWKRGKDDKKLKEVL